MAELLSILSREFDYNQLTEDVLRCVPPPVPPPRSRVAARAAR